MSYIKIATNTYPLNEAEIIAAHPGSSFPIPFSPPDGYAKVEEKEPPAFNGETHGLVELAPKKVSGKWVQQWSIVALPAEAVITKKMEAQAKLLNAVRDEAQLRLDIFARSRRYDDIISLASYATSKDEVHAAEGQRGVDLRDAVWGALKAIEVDVLAGTRAMPTFDEAIAELPTLTWA